MRSIRILVQQIRLGTPRAISIPTMGDVVVIGAGGAAWSLCQRLVADGWRGGRISVLGDETRAPYARAHLVQVLRGGKPEAAALAPVEWYAANGIDLRLDDPAVAIDLAHGRVATARGDAIPFAHLVLATGSGPWLPPLAGRDQIGVLALRTLDDAVALRAAARRAQRAVVLGGGPFGVETAAALNDAGVAVDLVEVAAGLCLRWLDLACAGLLRAQVKARGIDVHTGRQAVRVTPAGRSLLVRCADGGDLESDLVVIAAGTRPRDELAAACGLRRGLRGGVVVDAAMRTNDPRVLAIGECAVRDGEVHAHPEAVQAMAATAAATLVGRRATFAAGSAPRRLLAPGLDALSVGAVHGSELDRRVAWQGEGARRVLVVRGAHLVGACGVGTWPEEARVAQAVSAGATVWPWQISQFRRAGNLWPAPPASRAAARMVSALHGGSSSSAASA